MNKRDEKSPSNLTYVDTKYKSLMFFNTTIRNVGLYTSVSIALLGFATRMKTPNKGFTSLLLLLSSLAFLIFAIMLNYNLYTSMKGFEKDTPSHKEDYESWTRISELVFPVHLVIGLVLIGYIFYNIRNRMK